jgi:hypothetical protein
MEENYTFRCVDEELNMRKQPFVIKSFCGGLNQWVSCSVSQWVSKQMTAESASNEKFLLEMIMVPRPHPVANEKRHQRFAQHIGSPRRGAGGQG